MIDARGQLCPMPVIMVQKAAKENPAEIQVLVDDPCAVDNITRFAGNNGCNPNHLRPQGGLSADSPQIRIP